MQAPSLRRAKRACAGVDIRFRCGRPVQCRANGQNAAVRPWRIPLLGTPQALYSGYRRKKNWLPWSPSLLRLADVAVNLCCAKCRVANLEGEFGRPRFVSAVWFGSTHATPFVEHLAVEVLALSPKVVEAESLLECRTFNPRCPNACCNWESAPRRSIASTKPQAHRPGGTRSPVSPSPTTSGIPLGFRADDRFTRAHRLDVHQSKRFLKRRRDSRTSQAGNQGSSSRRRRPCPRNALASLPRSPRISLMVWT